MSNVTAIPTTYTAPVTSTSVTVNADQLNAALKATLPFVCKYPTRFHLATVAMVVDGGYLAFVATNGHALARAVTTVKVPGDDRVLCLIPHASAKTMADRAKSLAKINAPLTIEVGTTIAKFSAGALETMQFTHVDSVYPPYKTVIPESRTPIAHIYGAKKQDIGEASPVIGFNPRYMVDACKAADAYTDNTRAFRMSVPTGSLDPMRFDATHPDHGSLTIVIMPMRIE
jgi:DNA polymerase III sliding clamp (beta) subunit (PCNA family)